MIAPSDELADARSGHFSVLLCKIHRHLAGHYEVVFAAPAVDGRCGYVEMIAHRIENIVDSKGLVVYLYGTFNHSLGQTHIDAAVVNHAVCQLSLIHI